LSLLYARTCEEDIYIYINTYAQEEIDRANRVSRGKFRCPLGIDHTPRRPPERRDAAAAADTGNANFRYCFIFFRAIKSSTGEDRSRRFPFERRQSALRETVIQETKTSRYYRSYVVVVVKREHL